MVDKRKDQDISFTTAQQTVVDNFVRSEKRSSMLIGLVLGFIFNTISVVSITLVYIEVDKSTLVTSAVQKALQQYITDTKEMEKSLHE